MIACPITLRGSKIIIFKSMVQVVCTVYNMGCDAWVDACWTKKSEMLLFSLRRSKIEHNLCGLFKLVCKRGGSAGSFSIPRDWAGVIIAVPPLRWKPPVHVRCAGGGPAYAHARPTQQQCWFPPARRPGLTRPPSIVGGLGLWRSGA
jgi:hypothetical protein